MFTNNNGCDPTSPLYSQGKIRCIKVLGNKPELKPLLTEFSDPTADQETIAKSRRKFLSDNTWWQSPKYDHQLAEV